LIYGASMFVYS